MNRVELDRDVIALGVRQPWAELIVRGKKTIEIRSLSTPRRGLVYIYASKKLSDHPAALLAANQHGLDLEKLPRGVLVGLAELVDSRPCKGSDARAACLPAEYLKDCFGWHLAQASAFARPFSVKFLPYGIWFYPYKRRNAEQD